MAPPSLSTNSEPLGGEWSSAAAAWSAAVQPDRNKETASSPNVHILIKNTFIQFEDPTVRPLLEEGGCGAGQNRPRGESCDAVLYQVATTKDRCSCPTNAPLLCIPEYNQDPLITAQPLVEDDETETPSKLQVSDTTAADNEDSESQPSSSEGGGGGPGGGGGNHQDNNCLETATTPRRQRQRNSNFTPASRSSLEVSPAELMESLSAFEQTKRMPLEDLPIPSHDKTTIMLRNIPNKYTQAMLLEAVNQDFRGLYDFFYLPIDFKNKCNVGYAFINFIHPYYAELFSTKFAGLKLTAFKSKKICEVSWGRVQGLRANIEHYRNSAIMSIPNSQYKPLIFKDGVPLQFPGPAGPVPSVKPRHGRHQQSPPSVSQQ
eukprot:Protomagalhaensia_sp_Gyna_25__1787@NODE_1941_length_1398_cov_23_568801_g1600_i0_p1_GENE_NODE_1941_length_1398_cov_23_568801_g1600_i0NODE_1941_length_1398_cov_23_568801_g1600_i0_p1_ORF_typecomplete_len375_score69_17RRM_2/PF04059_12/9_3e37Smg4_UPF3/PF03467_15/0_032RRM_1/PF00076_22/0_07SelK_SelG/PF10961_8/8_2e03SelK_SelG/PF10961_8/9_3SelK_SelG/PF10961_8/1_6e03_NODE_1941_length_1398_cov_23_568801_g1600_i01881312